MLINVHITWKEVPSPLGFPHSTGTGWAFNTETKQMEQTTASWYGAMLDPRPADIYYPDGSPIYIDCDNFAPGSDPTNYSATVYYYKRAGESFTTGRVDNSIFCGYVEPDTRTCKIIVDDVTVSYDQATVQCSKYVGPLQFSLDGGVNRQTDNVFKELSPGDYEASVYDLGATLQTCFNTRKFTISATPPTGAAASVADLPAFCFAGNPVLINAQAAVAYHQVITQVWVESAHRSGSYQLAYESQRRSNSEGQVQLDVQDILRAQLSSPLTVNRPARVLDSPLRNWFVRVADVLPQNGQPGTWVNSNNSVVLFGGLAPEPLLAKADYWNHARVARLFHTWQPLSKRVGQGHLEVLQFLVPDSESYTVRVKWYDAQGLSLPTRTLPIPGAALLPTPANAVVPPAVAPAQQVRLIQHVLDVATYYGASQLVVDVVTTAGALAGLDTAASLCWPRVLDVATSASPRQLIYQNSLGGFDTLALFGKMSAKLTIDSQPVDAYQSNAGALTTTRLVKSWPGTPTTPVYSLATGWLSADWLEYVQEVVQPGRDVYEYVQGELRPVVMTTKELITYQETDGLTGATLEYKPALLNEYYSDYARNTNQEPGIGAGWK